MFTVSLYLYHGTSAHTHYVKMRKMAVKLVYKIIIHSQVCYPVNAEYIQSKTGIAILTSTRIQVSNYY